jgi:2-polyprenyl-6-hydroxyphenyl methylase/3-demethylubiquinone-9 3-methyltransferase
MTTTSEEQFFKYYEAESASASTMERFTSVKAATERVAGSMRARPRPWKVLDVGCGAGAQCAIWARDGHDVAGIDINEKLIQLGRDRAGQAGLKIDLRVGSATQLPWPDRSKDIVLCPELLEHVEDWEGVVREMMRVQAPGGLLFLSTTNRLCPKQEEFNLPAYSWYPAPLKRHYERLARTTRPEIANHAKFPAVNWFTYYQLRDYLGKHGYKCVDRFDIAALAPRGLAARSVLGVIRSTALTRWIGQAMSSYTLMLAKSPDA